MLTPDRWQKRKRLVYGRAPKFFNSHEVEFYDGSPLLIHRKLDRDSPLYIEGDGHPNEAGARQIAEINWPFLEARLTEFCKRQQCFQE